MGAGGYLFCLPEESLATISSVNSTGGLFLETLRRKPCSWMTCSEWKPRMAVTVFCLVSWQTTWIFFFFFFFTIAWKDYLVFEKKWKANVETLIKSETTVCLMELFPENSSWSVSEELGSGKNKKTTNRLFEENSPHRNHLLPDLLIWPMWHQRTKWKCWNERGQGFLHWLLLVPGEALWKKGSLVNVSPVHAS